MQRDAKAVLEEKMDTLINDHREEKSSLLEQIKCLDNMCETHQNLNLEHIQTIEQYQQQIKDQEDMQGSLTE